MLWDRSLEDVIEDDDEEQHISREEAVQQHEANQVCMGKEDYMVCAKACLRVSVEWSLETEWYSHFPISWFFDLVFFFSFLITIILLEYGLQI